MTLTKITDHTTQAKARLIGRFKGKTRLESLVDIFTTPIQDIENAFWDVYTMRAIDTGTGLILDVIGRYVNQPRLGLGDVDYRLYLKARIATNRSGAVAEDLIIISRLILNNAVARVVLDPQNYAFIIVRVDGAAVTATTADILISFLRQAKGAGIRLILESSTSLPVFQLDVTGLNSFSTLDLTPLTTAVQTVLAWSTAGTGGNVKRLRFLDTGVGYSVSQDTDHDWTFEYNPGVTTVANFESAINDSGVMFVLTPDGVGTITSGDMFTYENFSGGLGPSYPFADARV